MVDAPGKPGDLPEALEKLSGVGKAPGLTHRPKTGIPPSGRSLNWQRGIGITAMTAGCG